MLQGLMSWVEDTPSAIAAVHAVIAAHPDYVPVSLQLGPQVLMALAMVEVRAHERGRVGTVGHWL